MESYNLIKKLIFLFFTQDGSLDKLIMSEFLILANSIEKFQKESEVISGKQSTSLRLALQNQVFFRKSLSKIYENFILK